MSAAKATRDGGLAATLAAWLTALLLGMVGIGLVLPAGTAAPAVAQQLIGHRTGDVLVVPALKMRAPLVSIAMSRSRVLTPPARVRDVGWWDRSATPGSTHGQTLVTGHTKHTGGGAMDHLGRLHPGDRVRIVRTTGHRQRTTSYRVTAVRTYSKAAISRNADALFGQSGGDGRLVLVTCTGWDGHEYHGNVVVFAERLRSDVEQVA